MKTAMCDHFINESPLAAVLIDHFNLILKLTISLMVEIQNFVPILNF